jgi:hypothetical protein
LTAKEREEVKQLGEHKWVAIIAIIAILLSVGAIAWAAVAWAEGKDCPGRDRIGPTFPQRDNVGQRLQDAAPNMGAMAGDKDRGAVAGNLREQGIQRVVALLDRVRDDMTVEDQAQYDALVETFKDQRAEVQEATQELADTLKELRALLAKYVGPESDEAE